MTLDIPRQRLHNQFLSRPQLSEPDQVVEYFGAMQAQDYAGAKWALGLRLTDARDAAVEAAFDKGKILRTHVMRPTWHFVAPADILWMLELTAPRVRTALAFMDRQLKLDRTIIKKSNSALRKALQGDQQRTRAELAPMMEKAGVSVEGLRLGHLLMHAELDGVICSGARKGKQFTYALLEERAPQARKLDKNEALIELTRRYFRSHGPATLRDFVWWSGLTMSDARKGVEAAQAEFEREVIGGQTYWFPWVSPAKAPFARAHLLPNYDEYTVGYKDRSAIFDASQTDKLGTRERVLVQSILTDGQIAGTWSRTLKKTEVVVQANPFNKLDAGQIEAVAAAAARYGRFLGLSVDLVTRTPE
jgi:hypothetical protein